MSYFSAQTLDDALREVSTALIKDGKPICSTKGPSVELFGILLEIENPRARLSRTETRGKPFGCLGELCWYLSKNESLKFIEYYLPYEDYADEGLIHGAYGPRLFNWNGLAQFQRMVDLLKQKRSSRQAVIQLFSAQDLLKNYKHVPCTCYLQFVIRDEKLTLMTTMRSNDAYKGLPHDMFCFSMLQEILARMLDVEVGTYKHAVGSLHLYDTDRSKAEQFINEGWQSTGKDIEMPAMPSGDPWSEINALLRIESQLRLNGKADEDELGRMSPYWADLGRMLQIFQYKKKKDLQKIECVQSAITSPIYRTFVDKIKSELQ